MKKPTKKFIKKLLNRLIDNKWGTYNKICPNCLERAGHKLLYCPKCPSTMDDYDKQKHGKIKNKAWVNKATTLSEQKRRLDLLFFSKFEYREDSEHNNRGWATAGWYEIPIEERKQIIEEILEDIKEK